MRFSVAPAPGDSGFSQWRDAMRMVARLPGGIPPDFRRRLWLTLAERHLAARGVDWARAHRLCFNEWSNPDDEELGVQIVKDLHRTGCSLFCGAEAEQNQALLKRVLLAYARWNKAVGYCQGFNMLAALILQVMDRSEADSVKVMIFLVEGVLPESYFANNLRGLSVDMAVFRDLLSRRLPALSRHLDRLQVAANDASSGTSYEPPLTNVFTMQWFLTLFSNCLPQPAVLRVWDLIFLEGNEVLLRTALAIWDGLADRILAVNSADEFYSIMGVLTREMLEFGLMDTNNLVKTVVNLAPFPFPELNELRDKYLYNITPWTQSVSTAAKRGLKIFYSDDDDETDEDDEKIAVAAAYGISTVFRSPRRKDGTQREQTSSSLSALNYSGTVPDRERLALDISALKQQYAKLRERQRQAHIILTAACTRQPLGPTSSTPVAMNHLLLGKSALMSMKGRRVGPPPGAVPPPVNLKATRPGTKPPVKEKPTKPSSDLLSPQSQLAKDEGETLHWKDAASYKKPKAVNITSSSMDEKSRDTEAEADIPQVSRDLEDDKESDSSSSTELCDEPDRLSDFDSEEATSLSEASSYVSGHSLSVPLPCKKDGSTRSPKSMQSPLSEKAPSPISTQKNLISPVEEEVVPEIPEEVVSVFPMEELKIQAEQQELENGGVIHTKTESQLTVSTEAGHLQSVLPVAADGDDLMVKVTVQDSVKSEKSVTINGSNKYFHSLETVTFLERNLINSDILKVPESEGDKTIISQDIKENFQDTSNVEILPSIIQISHEASENQELDISSSRMHSIKESERYVTTATGDNIFSSVILESKKTENLSTDMEQIFPETSTVPSIVMQSIDKDIISSKDTSASDSKYILEPSEKERSVDYEDMSVILEFNQRLHGLHDKALSKAPGTEGDSDYLQMSELLEIDHKMHSGRRNSERALKIIQENSEILQRILQCQMRRASKFSEEGSNGTNGVSEDDSDSVKAPSVPSSTSTENVPFFLSAECKKLSESILSKTIVNDSFQEHHTLTDEHKVPIPVIVSAVSKTESQPVDVMTSFHNDKQTKQSSMHFISSVPISASYSSDSTVNPTALDDINSKIFPQNTEATTFDKETGREKSFSFSFPSSILASDEVPTSQKEDKPFYTGEENSTMSMSFPDTTSKASDSSTDFKVKSSTVESEDHSSFWGLWNISSTSDESSIDSQKLIKSCASHMLKDDHSSSERSFRPIIVHSSSLDKTGFRDEKLPRPLSEGDSQDPHYSNIGRKYVPTISAVDCPVEEPTQVTTSEALPRKHFEQFSYTRSFAVKETPVTASFSPKSSVLDLKHPVQVSDMHSSFLSQQESRSMSSCITEKHQQPLESTQRKLASIESELEFQPVLTHSLSETREDETSHRSGKESRPLSPTVTEMLNRSSSSGSLQGSRSKLKKDFVSPPPSPFRRYTSPVRKTSSLERPVSLHFSKGSSSFDSSEDGKMRYKTSPLYKSFSMLSVNEAGEIQHTQYDSAPRHRKKDPLRRRTSTDLSISFSSTKSKSPKATSPVFSPSKLKETGVSFPPIKSVHQADSPTKSAKFSPFPTRAGSWQPKELGIKLGLYSSTESSGRSSNKKL
ncbi:uncharacterized protein LOC124776685 [Schistocerca piceifrons]|uniref:uncharacterized protein LOC124776685 n=1 Tax=Schistocerca piceifrons TaxID=274613 RepID=UPI001F5F0E8D|nr:uncharacterized protein LOC124776685 [Schistocerca piceifrons]